MKQATKILVMAGLWLIFVSVARGELLSHYTFDVDTSDSGSVGRDGTIVGSGSIQSSDVKLGSGALDLSGGYVDLTSGFSALNNLAEVTIAAWVNLDSANGVGYDAIFMTDSGDSSSSLHFQHFNTANQISAWWWSGAAAATYTVPTSYPSGWYHVVFTRNQWLAKIYIDGVERTFNNGITVVTTDLGGACAIGGWQGGRFWDGRIDDLRIYDHAIMSPEDIQAIMAGTEPSDPPVECDPSHPCCTDELPISTDMGYVVISPNGPLDCGDYGPYTPGTQTSGFQEALDYARDNRKDVYVVGGGVSKAGGKPVVYHFNTTLNVPWSQNWKIVRGGNYIMDFDLTSGDCVVIDSQMNSEISFGRIVAKSLQTGTVVHLKATTEGPDNFTIIVSNFFEFDSIVGGGVYSEGIYEGRGTGLRLDDELGSVLWNEIHIGEIAECQSGIKFSGVGNRITCPLIQNCDVMIGIISGAAGPTDHSINASLKPHADAINVLGASLDKGQLNTYHLTWLNTNEFDPGNCLIFGSDARDNTVFAVNLPVDGVSNNASIKSNHVFPVDPVGFGIPTPSVPANNTYLKNSFSYSVLITILTNGSVTGWFVRDVNGTTRSVTATLTNGQQFYLEPGDEIKLFYVGAAPTWAWQALR